MSDFARFGSPELFEIAARWTADDEPRQRLPMEGGWSTADIQITVAGQALTARRIAGHEKAYLSWYLQPLIQWFIQRWTWLFHEEAYAWTDRSGKPAATAAFAALGRAIASPDEMERMKYREIQAWWQRHALRAADSSALLPDVCFRRFGDDIEVSWGGRPPAFAPEGFAFTLLPGYACFSVEAVAKPIWHFLDWAIKTAPVSEDIDRLAVQELDRQFHLLKRTTLRELELRHLGERVQALIDIARKCEPLGEGSVCLEDVPAIASLDPAVLMFGGLEPTIDEQDATELLRFMARHRSASESQALLDLVETHPTNPGLTPHDDGYGRAEDVRDELGIPADETCVDLEHHLHRLGIKVEEIQLRSNSVRGVAVAGKGFEPAILINTASTFNRTPQGRRFTAAHEFCHILFDRTRAKRLSHVSGPWTDVRVEKRANAFAAMFLASRMAVRRTFKDAAQTSIKEQAKTLQVSGSALVEHLYNLDVIDEATREQLRSTGVS